MPVRRARSQGLVRELIATMLGVGEQAVHEKHAAGLRRRWAAGTERPATGTGAARAGSGRQHPRMAIVPDEKDWTWVLERTCPECGFDARSTPATEVGEALRANAHEWRTLLAHPQARVRPDDATWSALEYACHVRDVFRLYQFRLRLMLDQDDPDFPNWDQDASAIDDGYAGQDPSAVTVELEAAGGTLADTFATVTGAQWARTGNRSDGARFTIDTFARYLLHDPVHHVWDVQRGYAALSAS